MTGLGTIHQRRPVERTGPLVRPKWTTSDGEGWSAMNRTSRIFYFLPQFFFCLSVVCIGVRHHPPVDRNIFWSRSQYIIYVRGIYYNTYHNLLYRLFVTALCCFIWGGIYFIVQKLGGFKKCKGKHKKSERNFIFWGGLLLATLSCQHWI